MENVDTAVYFPFSISELEYVIDSLKQNFPFDVFVGVSDRILCHSVIFGREDDGGRRLMNLLISIYKTAGYCLDDCFASCENIVWISFKRMCGKLLLPPPPPPARFTFSIKL